MKNHRFLSVCAAASALALSACPNPAAGGGGGDSSVLPPATGSTVIGHEVARLKEIAAIPAAVVEKTKGALHIAYGHTSHGSQIVDGLKGLPAFLSSKGISLNVDIDDSKPGDGQGLHLYEGSGYSAGDLDHDAGYSGWDQKTRDFLDNPANAHFNVIMWSWCGQIKDHSEASLKTHYLDPMAQLEKDFPKVAFVYMTGHLATDPVDAPKVNARNEQVRKYCRDNKKWLFDFADIESYDPDGIPYLSKLANDECNYDSDGNGSLDANWATAWQAAHPGDYYGSGFAHTQPANANMKAYAAWYLFARIAGWDGK